MEPPKQNKAETDLTMKEKDVEDHSVQDNTTEISKGVATPIPVLGAPELEIELSVDDVLERYVGSLGRSQVLQVLLVSLAWMLDAQNTLVTIFTDNNTSGAPLCGHGLPLEASRESVGGHTSSIIAEWVLVCDRNYLAAVPASLLFIGSLLGSAFFGKLADGVLGRKRTAAVSCLLCSATAFATSVSPNIWVYSFLRFANGFARSGIGICSLVLLTEAVGRKWRGQVGQYCFFFYTLGFLSLPLMAYQTRTNWRSLYKIISILPLAYTLLLLPFVSESPRWLLVRGRDSEAIDVLKRYARLNGKALPANVTLSKPMTIDERDSTDERLWSTKWAAKRMVLVMIASFGIGFVYYGIQLNVENLSFNLYVTVALNAVMEIPAVFIGSLLMCFMNRRIIFCLFAAIAGAACILCIIFSHGRGGGRDRDRKVAGGSWAQLSVEAVGFMAASTAFDVLLIYSVELFPTSVRNFAVSHLRQAVMLGASLAPPLVALGRIGPAFSFLILGVVSILSGVSTLWLPETRNAPLYETLKQQEEEEEKKVTRQVLRADSSGLPDA